ncbi:kinesin-like protein KIF25 [Microcebus murinus]|uniref:kinesin-like protein KIF25 n=1 Tax=Microcebus murinus TaxID=30608 RepID=UPI003F6AD1AF
MLAGGGQWGGFWEQRARQLQRLVQWVRVREEPWRRDCVAGGEVERSCLSPGRESGRVQGPAFLVTPQGPQLLALGPHGEEGGVLTPAWVAGGSKAVGVTGGLSPCSSMWHSHCFLCRHTERRKVVRSHGAAGVCVAMLWHMTAALSGVAVLCLRVLRVRRVGVTGRRNSCGFRTVKEERIVELEMQNAVLHLRLAEVARSNRLAGQVLSWCRDSLAGLRLLPAWDPSSPQLPPSLPNIHSDLSKTQDPSTHPAAKTPPWLGVLLKKTPREPPTAPDSSLAAPRQLHDSPREPLTAPTVPDSPPTVPDSPQQLPDSPPTTPQQPQGAPDSSPTAAPDSPLTAPGPGSPPLDYRDRIGESRSEATLSHARDRRRLQSSWCSALNRLRPGIQVLIVHFLVLQRLKRDLKEFHSSSLVLLRSYQDQCEACVSAIVAAVGRTQLDGAALQACRSEVVRLEQALQETGARYQAERQRRRLLHNTLVELRGNVRVHCRVRPLLPLDHGSADAVSQNSAVSAEAVRAADDETVLVKCDRPGHPSINKTYHFDRVYGPADSQGEVFGDVRPLLTSLLDGYNVCVVAYGQTGSGKSYTMLGPPAKGGAPQSDAGIVPRAAGELFRLIAESPPPRPQVGVSVVEVYNNDVFDLLAKDSRALGSGARRGLPAAAGDGRKEATTPTCDQARALQALFSISKSSKEMARSNRNSGVWLAGCDRDAVSCRPGAVISGRFSPATMGKQIPPSRRDTARRARCFEAVSPRTRVPQTRGGLVLATERLLAGQVFRGRQSETRPSVRPQRAGTGCVFYVAQDAGLITPSCGRPWAEPTAGRGCWAAAPPACPTLAVVPRAVGSASELLRLVRGGLRRRATHATLVHEDSSRSHLIVTVTVTTAPGPGVSDPVAGAGRRKAACGPARPPDPTDPAERASAQLQLVDLAGSECAGVSGAAGSVLREASWINRSLAALADVLGALAERRGHVPYRNSRLTRLLQDSLGGDAKFLVILCVSPGQRRLAQTLQGLGFGARARQVERGPARRRPSARAGEGSTG